MLLAQASQEASPYTAYIVFGVGFALMIAEMMMPGVILGLIGLVGVIAGIVLSFSQGNNTAGAILTVVAVVSAPAFLIVWAKFLGPALAVKATVENDTQQLESLHSLLGQQGVAVTTLRPAGIGQFGPRRIDVVSDGEIIDANTRIQATEVQGNRIVVRAVKM